MAIKKAELKQLKDFYIRNGYLNIFIEGAEGVGKTSFGLHILNKICKETHTEMSLRRVYYNLNKFLGVVHTKLEVVNNLNKKINIINIAKNQDLNSFKLPYFKFEVFQDMDSKGIVKRGYYRFQDVLGKFKEGNKEDLYTLQLKRQKEIRMSMSKTFNNKDSIDIKNADDKEFKEFVHKLRNCKILLCRINKL